ncbi:MAG: radical SAM protein [Deltaproteobacteria bacterium]|nr:radical SAM protein [Deltaproteobacteria bacterium]
MTSEERWARCRFFTASVLPVRVACNCACLFCFSRSSVSALPGEGERLRALDVEGHLRWARARGATRAVLTGGGEPLLVPELAVWLVSIARRVFDEVALFTNAARLTPALAERFGAAGLSYLCWSRHHHDDDRNRALMGPDAPARDAVLAAVGALPVRATCVLSQGFVDSPEAVREYLRVFQDLGVRSFTFKHTYVAYARSLFRGSPQDGWARSHRVALDPFEGLGEVLLRLPWGPTVRRLEGADLCFYQEPTPEWELSHGLCRSSNLLSDGRVYASLEDTRSLLYRLQ